MHTTESSFSSKTLAILPLNTVSFHWHSDPIEGGSLSTCKPKFRYSLRSNQAKRGFISDYAKYMINYVRFIKIGAIFVCHPQEQILESPIGDSTMLPVVSLRELQYVDNWTVQSLATIPQTQDVNCYKKLMRGASGMVHGHGSNEPRCHTTE